MATAHVAVVDDEMQVRVALGRLLRLAGYEVSGYAGGEEFLASLARRVPDCTLLDVNMPGLDGLQVLAKLRADRVATPVVVITASDDHAVERSALQAGGLRLLRKPIGSDELLAAVDDALHARLRP